MHRRVRKARTLATESATLIESEAGSVELVGLRLSLLRDTGQLLQALRLARSAASADYQDLDSWRVAHYNLGLIEGAVGNTDRASHSWSEAARCSRVLYRVGAMVNLARDLLDAGELRSASRMLKQADRDETPRVLTAFRFDTWARVLAERGHWPKAIKSQEACLSLLVDESSLRIARHTTTLVSYLVRAGLDQRAQATLDAAKSLVFDLEDERQELAAAAMVNLMKAATARKLTSAVVDSALRLLDKASRWDRSNPHPASKSRQS